MKIIKEIAKKEFDVNKEHWEEILSISRKKLLTVFLAGATVASIVWIFVGIIIYSTI